MGAGTSIIAGYIGGKLRGRKRARENKPKKHRIRNYSRKTKQHVRHNVNTWKKKRSERKRIE
jgi:hypothetical protein